MDWMCGTLRWKSSCPVLILAASILSSCFLLIQAEDIPVTVEPSHPLEGQDVTLTPGGPPDFFICKWFRGEVATNKIFRYVPFLNPAQTYGPSFTGRESRGPSCSLHIRSLVLNDTGNYTVIKITADGFRTTGRVHLEVLDTPNKPIVSVSPSPYPVEFESLHLTCETHSGHAEVRWFKNGSPLGNSVRISLSGDNQTLSIPSVTRYDAGQYQCEVSDSTNTTISNVRYVTVIYGPEKPVILPTRRLYQAQSDLQLTCEADTVPDAHYAWFFNGRLYGIGSELLIQDVTPEFSGNYVCQAMNRFTFLKSSSALEIEVEADDERDFMVTGPSVATEGQPVTLMCNFAGSAISYSWFKGKERLEAGHRVLLSNNNQNLTLDPSHRRDAGDYTCEAFNGISFSISKPHQLTIIYGPDPPLLRKIFYKAISKLIVTCRAAAFPRASYVWFLNGKLLPYQPHTLVRFLIPEYTGNYTCQAENISSQQKRNSTLEIEVLEE